MTTVELRCDVHPARLFAKAKLEGEQPKYLEGLLVEVSCRDCRSSYARQGRRVKHVLHRFNVEGALVETEVVD